MAKKIFLISFLVLLFFSLIPNLVSARLVPECTGEGGRCTWADFETMINNILYFLVWDIAPVIAVLMFTIGGIVFLCAGGSPNLKSLGKNVMLAAVIGAVIVFGAYAIIRFILNAIGYTGHHPFLPT